MTMNPNLTQAEDSITLALDLLRAGDLSGCQYHLYLAIKLVQRQTVAETLEQQWRERHREVVVV